MREPADVRAGSGEDPIALGEFGLDDGSDAWLDRVRAAEVSAPIGAIGPFTLLEEVGAGGQGIVYRAIDERTGRQVAIKHLLGGAFATPSTRQRLEIEVEAVARLSHPNVATLYSRESAEGLVVLSMEWIDGVPVTAWAAGRRSPREILELFVRITAALTHAHQRGVLHRDLKPSNILVDASSAPHVVDFGLAKTDAALGAGASELTRSGQLVGTPAYASPEQARGDRHEVDVRSDVYALGVILHEALTGRMPYPVDGPLLELLGAIERVEPRPPSSLRRGLHRDIDAIVMKTLRKSPADRYQSMSELGADLARFLRGEPVEAKSRGPIERLGLAVRRHRVLVVGAAAAGLLVVGYMIVMPILYRAAARETEKAIQVQHFLEDMLASASPYQAGRDANVAHLLEAAADRIETDLQNEPAVAADIHKAIARTYGGIWWWQRAEEHAGAAAELYTSERGRADADVATCLNLRARALAFQRDPRCLDVVEEALAIRRRLHGGDHPEIAESLSTTGFSRWQVLGADDAEAAEVTASFYRAGLAMYERSLDAPTVRWARALFSTASFEFNRREFATAARLYERSLAMYRSFRGGGEGFYLARVLNGYAVCLLQQGRSDEAEPLLIESLGVPPAGYVDLAVVRARWHLGEIARSRDEEAAARDHYDEMLAACCEIIAHRSDDDSAAALEGVARALRSGLAGAGVYDEAFAALARLEPLNPGLLADPATMVEAVLAVRSCEPRETP